MLHILLLWLTDQYDKKGRCASASTLPGSGCHRCCRQTNCHHRMQSRCASRLLKIWFVWRHLLQILLLSHCRQAALSHPCLRCKKSCEVSLSSQRWSLFKTHRDQRCAFRLLQACFITLLCGRSKLAKLVGAGQQGHTSWIVCSVKGFLLNRHFGIGNKPWKLEKLRAKRVTNTACKDALLYALPRRQWDQLSRQHQRSSFSSINTAHAKEVIDRVVSISFSSFIHFQSKNYYRVTYCHCMTEANACVSTTMNPSLEHDTGVCCG